MGKVYTMLNTQCTALAEATEKIHAHWTFRDITGTIVRKGLSHEQLLTDCINVGYLIMRQAMERKESRGLHYNIDYPKKEQ